MASTIKLKNGSGAPTSGQLVQGEPALDLTNKRLYTENASGTVIEVGTNPSSLTTASADINGGTIDGTVIGGSSAAAGSFTTISASGEIAANGGVALPDSGQATFGAGDDLKIYHTGSHSYIDENGTGNLYIGSNNGGGVYIQGSGENLASFIDDGAVMLYYDNAEKLATTATGIDVTGTVTADGLTVENSTFPTVNINNASGTRLQLEYDTNNAVANVRTTVTAPLVFETNNIDRLEIAGNGDISFYEDTGTTAKFFWDASAESLGIGTTSPSGILELSAGTNLNAVFNQLSMDNASNEGIGIQFSRTTSTSFLSAIGITETDKLTFASRSGLNFYTGGVSTYSGTIEAMRIDSSGNVGIGTSSPAEKLHIKGAANGDGLTLQRDSVTQNDYAQLGFLVSTNDAGTPSAWIRGLRGGVANQEFLTFGTSNTERMRIDSAGNVGIGTSSPSDTLHVTGANTGTTNIRIESNEAPRNNFIGCSGYDDLVIAADESNLGATSTIQFRVDATERMRIDSAGNVGIGTTNPLRTLDIRASTPTFRLIETGSGELNYLDITVDTNGTTYNATFSSGGAPQHIWQTANNERARIDSSGNLLIGTSTAGASKLVVNDDSIQVNTAKTPASASDTGTTGEIAWDANYVYVCVATNTWKRSALSTW